MGSMCFAWLQVWLIRSFLHPFVFFIECYIFHYPTYYKSRVAILKAAFLQHLLTFITAAPKHR